MKWKPFVVGWALVLTLLLFAQHRTGNSGAPLYANIIDLTHAVSDTTPTPGLHNASAKQSSYFVFDEQASTRMEAPSQFARGMWSVDEVPTERLVRPMVVIDVHEKVRRASDYRLSMQDVADFEQLHGRIPQGSVVLAYTGWDDRWSSPALYHNASADGTMHFPGYTLEAAEFLIAARQTVGLGIDTLSTDGGNSTSYSVHRYSAVHSVYHLENLSNLARVPESGGFVVVTPLKLEKGTGAPVRVLAMIK